jgi:thiamine biosynthesis lipoprotein
MTVVTLPLAAAPPDRSFVAERTLRVPSMGGDLVIRVAHRPRAGDAAGRPVVTRDLLRVARRVDRWAARLTRYRDSSELCALNADPSCPEVAVGPTLTATLAWAERAMDLCPDLVDVTLLEERLAAETGSPDPRSLPLSAGGRARWHLVRRPRGGLAVRHEALRFDLDGVAKGWIADRALAMLRDYPAALVDADGDIALRLDDGVAWDMAIADPRRQGDTLAVLQLDGRLPGGLLGVATSGTSVHRWRVDADGSPRHHLIDPRTRCPARTDVIQATVMMATARQAEILAKAVVIAGSDAGMDLLDRPGVHGAVLLLDSGDTIAPPKTLEWLA